MLIESYALESAWTIGSTTAAIVGGPIEWLFFSNDVEIKVCRSRPMVVGIIIPNEPRLLPISLLFIVFL